MAEYKEDFNQTLVKAARKNRAREIGIFFVNNHEKNSSKNKEQ
jgi:hypothetical protein